MRPATSNSSRNGSGHRGGARKRSDRYATHAERFGVELVFETAAGLGALCAELTAVELVTLGRRLRAIDPKFDPARPDQLVELSAREIRDAYLDRIAPVLDALATPAPTSAGRSCEWCGKAIAGRADRRTCSGAHREALRRAGGVGPFSRPQVSPRTEPELRVGLREVVTLTARRQRPFQPENRGVGSFREVSAVGAAQ